MRVLLIESNDWTGIYVEGELMDDGHDFEPDLLVAYTMLLGTKPDEFRALFYDYDNSILNSYLDAYGRMVRLPSQFLKGEFDELFHVGEFFWLNPIRNHLEKHGLL